MPVAPFAAVDLHIDPQDVPSVPPWCAGSTVLARHLTQRGIVDALCQHVRLARGRIGRYEVIDFIALLVGYARSDASTLEAFFNRLVPFVSVFMALFGRVHLPQRATLSRFLAAVDASCLADLVVRGPTGNDGGGLIDHQGQRLLVFDVDGTCRAARQRPLARGTNLPAPHRRLARACAPGDTGRKRGQVVPTRTSVLQAHTQQWLGTFGNAGNGDDGTELHAACRVITGYLPALEIPRSQGLLRLDGLSGTTSILAHIQEYGPGFVVRGRDYQLLTHPRVQARLQRPCDQEVEHRETHTQRELFEVGYLDDWLEPLPGLELTCRVIVAHHPAPATPEGVAVGKLIDQHVYELFLTSHPATGVLTADILDLSNQRGAFEQVLSVENQERDPDRWCSQTPDGQEFWQSLCQWVWNLRLELGQVGLDRPVRWTRWSDASADSLSPPHEERPETRCSGTAVEDEVVDLYGRLELSQEWAKARGRFAGQDFELHDSGTLECPAWKILHARERRSLPTGDICILYAAKATDCRDCPLASQCLWSARRASKHAG